jgi:FdhD protein
MEATPPELVRRFRVQRIQGSRSECILDTVAAEEPLEIRVTHWLKASRKTTTVAVTMRTPGHDRELAIGFLLSEGIIRSRQQLMDVRPLGVEPSDEILVELSKDVDVEGWRLAHHSFVNSSCGICGKSSREAIAQEVPARNHDNFCIDVSLIEKLPALLREGQRGFAKTGGLHAAACITPEGHIAAAFEDIGRHNALDKLIGWSLLSGWIPLRDCVLFLSSRSSFELVQKTAMAGAPILATVGGPSSLAIETARDFSITLIGFVREGRFNVYSGEWRIH